MNRLFGIVCSISFSALATLNAQTEAPPPGPPFVKNAPPASAWTVTFKIPGESAPSAPNVVQKNAFSEGILKELRVEKMQKNRHEWLLWSNGLTSERWLFNGIILLTQPGQTDIYVYDNITEIPVPECIFPDYSKSDFPELAWLSQQAYGGIKNYGKNRCYWYREENPAPSSSSVQGQPNKQTWIDLVSGLPVAYYDGNVLRTYTFHELASRPLELPASFAKVLQGHLESQTLSKHQMKF